MKKRALSLVGALAGIALLVAGLSDRVQLVEAADHSDGVDLMGTMASDVTDNYAWVWDDGGTPSLAMILNVDAASFPDNIQYAWTLVRDPLGTATVAQMICQFNGTAGDDVSCFFGDSGSFVSAAGDPSGSGFTQNGIRVFAGQRDDPFYFNSDGFSATATAVRASRGAIDPTNDGNGCPDLANIANAGDLGGNLDTAAAVCLTTSCDNGFGNAATVPAATNGFMGTVASIVVSVPLSMLPADADSDVVAVSASTHVAP